MRDRSQYDHGPMGQSIARIVDASARVAGAGFLIGPTRVATCAHVVTAALGGDPEQRRAPTGLLSVDFPLAGELEPARISARVREWSPIRPNGTGDVAVLELVEPPPVPARVPPLRRAERPWGHEFRVLGFPDGMRDGVWACGEFRDKQGTRWIQLHGAPNGQAIVEGFSGSPVWDADVNAVVGMTVAADRGLLAATAYLIPIEDVLGIDPELLPNPYRGLKYFDERHAAFFYGREDDIVRLVDAVERRPLVAVLGDSGTGKSSLVRAGLLPRLRASGARIAEFRPAPNAAGRVSFAVALALLLYPELEPAEQLQQADALDALRRTGSLTIRSLAAELAERAGDTSPVLFLDQFEEFAANDRTAARELMRLLIALIEAESEFRPLRVIFTLRWQALGDLLTPETAGSTDAAIVSVAPMNRTQLRDAIVGPTAHAPGLYFEPGLVERILDDAGTEPGQLPLVESLLTELWEQRAGGYLTTEAYARLGGVTGAVTQAAERILAGFPGLADGERLRRLFTMLARPAGTSFARRAVALDELPPDIRVLVDRLARGRLLVLGQGVDGRPIVELAHQALIDHWPRLRTLLESDLEFLRWREYLDQQIVRWEASGRHRDLLPHGTVLADARRWLALRGADHSALQHEFVGRGRAARNRRRALAVVLIVLGIVATSLITVLLVQSSR
ncbi:serine protease [Amycolatopsis anabasis]|uniref:serine protease n=1 Tax=Amycolatopsis anabasis TaxID=1840409 RepID=UPI00131DEA32|nr:serine protease [Amycolatopsis anabasis]